MSNPACLTIARSLEDIQQHREKWATDGLRVALIPTMGNLHEGHFSLVKLAREQAEKVVVSIFVNPLQFAQGEDFEHYPRTLEQDCLALTLLGVDVVFAPDNNDIYPDSSSMANEVAQTTTIVAPPRLTNILCGANRPGHFTGVTTIVGKLFHLVAPTVAVFGQKDYQQVAIIRQIVKDLNWSIQIIAAPTTRASDGLALSSRNQYLTDKQRFVAPRIYQTLLSMAERLHDGERLYAKLVKQATEALKASGFTSIDYVEIRNPENLGLSKVADQHWVLLIAARLGNTRLIDNLVVEASGLS
jgi:pantoate--beta-alanine ligase